MLIERPVLQPVAPLPLHLVLPVLILIPELHRDLVLPEREQLLAQSIVVLTRPLGREERDDGRVSAEKLVAVAPDAIDRVAVFNQVRVSVQNRENKGGVKVLRAGAGVGDAG